MSRIESLLSFQGDLFCIARSLEPIRAVRRFDLRFKLKSTRNTETLSLSPICDGTSSHVLGSESDAAGTEEEEEEENEEEEEEDGIELT